MQRGSDRLSVYRDDEMKAELRGWLQSGHPTRTEEWHDPEPFAEDDPEVAAGPVTPQRSPAPVDRLHYELARNLGRSPFPAGARRLRSALEERHAPDALVERMQDLPADATYGNAYELAEALVQESERGGEAEA
ncbi:DUF2795 domain-containing protein [Streptomyces odontomachi]|uniref:DUF2795 domain-containing protein n=1 Tax=Streptomyces odontomachi TaxID=2944940 RepID=UPI00210A909F|nr:DUF2795 domain-containing protein [Streptomyces sp. ODS25]